MTPQARDLAIQQIVSRAVVSTEIVDILAASGINSQDISILSDKFLAEVQQDGEEEPGPGSVAQADQRRCSLA